jgi:hypothetical protein
LHPDEVNARTSVQTWERWQAWEKTRAARLAFQREAAKLELSAGDKKLMGWAYRGLKEEKHLG